MLQKQKEKTLLWNHVGLTLTIHSMGFPVAQTVKTLPAVKRTLVQSLVWKDLLENGMDTRSSILAWRIPQTEEPGGPQSMGSQGVGHN